MWCRLVTRSSSQVLAAVQTNSSAGSILMVFRKHILMCRRLNPHFFPMVKMIINLIVGFYIPTQRIRFARLDDHPSYKELTDPSAQVPFILTLVISLRSLECQGPWVLRTRIETPWKFKVKQKRLEKNS